MNLMTHPAPPRPGTGRFPSIRDVSDSLCSALSFIRAPAHEGTSAFARPLPADYPPTVQAW